MTPSPTDGSSGASPSPEWYGGQTLAIDVVASGVLAGSAFAERGTQGALLGTGVSLYLVGAPFVHVAHGQPVTALGSLGLRAALPILGALAGAPFVTCRSSEEQVCDYTPPIVGFFVGFAAAIVTDAAVLAHEHRAREPSRPETSLALSPLIDAPRRGGGLAISGSF